MTDIKNENSKISKELKEYVTKHLPTISLWIKEKHVLQASMDFLKPIIIEFKKNEVSKGINLEGCSECIIDMLRWVRKEAKQDGEETKEEIKADKK